MEEHMIKKITLLFLNFFLALLFPALTYAIPGYTYVNLTNNTNENMEIQSTLTTEDSSFKKGKDWNESALTLAPYETKQVLWFSRNFDVELNKIYQFDLTGNSSNSSDPLTISFIEKGKSIYGSTLNTFLTLPNQSQVEILQHKGLEQIQGQFWNNHYTVYARDWLPTAGLFDNYHFVIDQPENNSFDTSSNQTLSVLTYNTQMMPFYVNVEDDLNQTGIRVQDIPKKITQYDVVILEELFDLDLRIKMTNAMGENYPYHTKVVGQNASKALTGGVMIFSKWPIIKEDQIVYQHSSGIDSLAAKGAGYAAINKNGKIYHLIGTHLQAGGGDGLSARIEQMQELADFIHNLNIPEDEPLLMGGDFNTGNSSDSISTLLSTLQVSLPNNTGYPYSSDSNINTMSTGSGHTRIDYVFYNNLHAVPKTTFNKVFILRDLENEKMWPKFDLSDHFPVVSYFDFSAQK